MKKKSLIACTTAVAIAICGMPLMQNTVTNSPISAIEFPEVNGIRYYVYDDYAEAGRYISSETQGIGSSIKEAKNYLMANYDDYATDTVVIPSEVQDVPVTSIAGRLFLCTLVEYASTGMGNETVQISGPKNVRNVVIPDSITSIGDLAFYGGDYDYYTCSVSDIYYEGTEAEWDAIEKTESNFDGITIHYEYTEGDTITPTPRTTTTTTEVTTTAETTTTTTTASAESGDTVTTSVLNDGSVNITIDNVSYNVDDTHAEVLEVLGHYVTAMGIGGSTTSAINYLISNYDEYATDIAVIAPEVLGKPVTEIDGWTFTCEMSEYDCTGMGNETVQISGPLNVRAVVIPDTVTKFGEMAFYGGDYSYCWCSVSDIYYEGTEEQWDAIDKGENVFGNETDFSKITIHYNYSEGEPIVLSPRTTTEVTTTTTTETTTTTTTTTTIDYSKMPATTSPDEESDAWNTTTTTATWYDGKYDTRPATSETDTVEDVTYGDLSQDGTVTLSDVVTLTKGVSGALILSDALKANADVNSDGAVTSADAALIARFLVGSIPTLPYTE